MNFSLICLLLSLLASIAQADVTTETFLLDLLEVGDKAKTHLVLAETAEPTAEPTAQPTQPTVLPTADPTLRPTRSPTFRPTTRQPTALPTPIPGDPTLAPTGAPTHAPSARPTAIPTFAPSYQTSPILTFSSNLTMGGIPTPELDANSQAALLDVTATSMGISVNTVRYVRGFPTPENRRRALYKTDAAWRLVVKEPLRAGISLFTTTYTIKSETEVNIPLSAAGSSNATQLYQQLTTSLDTAVSDGSFTTNLQAASVLYNATTLAQADVTGVSNSPPSVNNDLQFPPSSDDELTDGEIAGIVIGTFVGVALLCALIYYFMFIREGAQKEAFQSNADVEISL